MQRIVKIEPEQYTKLNNLAKKQHVSIEEINRRAIEQYLNFEISDEEMNLLNSLICTLEESNQKTLQNLEEVEIDLNLTLNILKKIKNEYI